MVARGGGEADFHGGQPAVGPELAPASLIPVRAQQGISKVARDFAGESGLA